MPFRTVLLASVLALGISSADHARAVDFGDVVRTVQEHGWRANLGRICIDLELGRDAEHCTFKQISVRETEGRGDPRGFNVAENGPTPLVLVFHLTPLIGEFFVLSPKGELLKAYYRAKGGGYDRLPNDEVSKEFTADLQYWLNNLERVQQQLRSSRSGG